MEFAAPKDIIYVIQDISRAKAYLVFYIFWIGGEDITICYQPNTGSQKIWVFLFTTLPQLLAK